MIINLFTQPLYSANFNKHDEYKSKLEPLLYQDIKEADAKNTHDEWWHCNSYQTYLRGYGQEDLESEMFTYIDEYMSELGYSGFIPKSPFYLTRPLVSLLLIEPKD